MKKLAILALPLAMALGACGETATETEETMPADTSADTMTNDTMTDPMADDAMADDTMTDPMADDTMADDTMADDDMTAEPTEPMPEDTTEPM